MDPAPEFDEDAVKRRFNMDGNAACSLGIGELVASAYVLCRVSTLSQDAIVNCIHDNHPYFRRRWASGDGRHDPAIQELERDVGNYIRYVMADFNISELPDGDMAVYMSPGSVFSLLKESSQKDCPRFHLDETSQSVHSPLDKLPVELKLMIIRHVCTHQGYRMSFESNCGRIAIFAYPITSAAEGWVEEAAWSWCPSLAELLPPLLLRNKQFRDLAHQTFYALNDFQCSDLATLNWFLETMGAEGRQYVRRITVRYRCPKEAQKFVKMIRECISLKSLTLVFALNHKPNGNIEVVDNKGHGKFTFVKPSRIPGLKELKSIFMPKKRNVVKLSAFSTSQSVQEVEAYMYEGVSDLG